VDFVLFGHVRATHLGQPVELGRRQERCLLGLLLIEAGLPISSDRLAELLWDGFPPSRSRSVIQTYVARLRRYLAPAGVGIASGSGGYCAEVAATDVDLHRFQQAVTAARQLDEPGRRAEALAAALGPGLLTGLGDQQGQAVTWDSLGYVHEKLGDHRRAVECYGSAVALGRETGGRAVEAQVLLHMGDNHCALGDQDAARTAWREAQVILDDLGHPDAHEAHARLTGQRL
jgi:tetratricopeptide (TPR) repeat protein